mmetsp:Transcript_13253/g.28987  ORF Transcript_13253/g.28987 Transcript_13253/m.28987 type:complete len:276 (+) Transcript_13253:639-1466(+)
MSAFLIGMPVPMSMSAMPAVATMSTMSVVFLAVSVMTVSVAVTSVATVATVTAVPFLNGNIFGLLIDFLISEVGHVVRSQVCELGHLHPALHSWQNFRVRIDIAKPVLHFNRCLCADQIQLVKKQFVAEGHLLVGLVDLPILDFIVESANDVFRIRDGDDAIQAQVICEVGIRHEGSHNGDGIRHARGFDHDLINDVPFSNLPKDLLQPLLKVAADGAAHAAVVHDDNLFCKGQFILLQQCVIDRNFSKFVFNDGDFLLLLLLQDVVEQRCLSGS